MRERHSQLGGGRSRFSLGGLRPRAGGGGGPVLTAPAQITAGQWTLTDSPSAGGDKLSLNITALPSNGGSAITALQYSLNAGSSWITLAGVGTGARIITVLAAPAVASVIVRAVNAIGNGLASTAKTQLPSVISTTPASTTPANTYTFAGDASAFTLTGNLSLGSYVMGEPFMLSDAAVSFTQTGAPSVAVGGYIANGLEVDFTFRNSGGTQGFDALAAATIKSGAIGALTYASGRNKDVTAAGANYPVAIGDEKTLIKSSRTVGADTDTWGVIDKYRVLTILPAAKLPNVGDFRPGIAHADKASWINVSDITFGGCLSVDVSGLLGGTGSDLPTYANTLAMWRTPIAFFAKGADPLRILQVMTHVISSNYSNGLAYLFWATAMHLHSNATSTAEKLALAKYIVQFAIDIEGDYSNGFPNGVGAGQHEFYLYVLALAALLTGKTRLRDALNGMRFNYDQASWATVAGAATSFPAGNQGGFKQNVGPIQNEYLGQATWRSNGGDVLTDDQSGLDRTYFSVSGIGRMRSVIPLLAFQANGSIPSGWDLMTNGGAQNDTSVARGAMIHLVDLERSTYPYDDANYLTGKMIATYTLLRSYIGVTKMSNFPPAIPIPFVATAGPSLVSWDMSGPMGTNYGSVDTPLTGIQIETSQDGVQFELESSTAASSAAAVPGIPLWVRARLQNANGWGAYSRTWKKYLTSTAETNKITPTGTATGTVTNTVAPKLFQKKYLNSKAPIFIPAADGLALGTPIFLGTGKWTGAISGSPTITVQTSATYGGTYAAAAGTIIADTVVGSYYEPVAADSGLFLRVGISRNGSAVVYSTPIQLGVLAAIPTDIIIDADWSYTDFVQYKAVYDSFVANNANVSTPLKRPAFSAFTDAPIEGDPSVLLADGVILAPKSSSQPTIKGDLGATKPLTIGGVYLVTARIPIAADGVAWGGDLRYGLGTTPTDYAYLTLTTVSRTGQPKTVDITFSFTATATSLFLIINQNTATGTAAGGNLFLDYVKVRRTA
jgi:hypothetical protein